MSRDKLVAKSYWTRTKVEAVKPAAAEVVQVT
jgi:hypothetical protein